MLTSKQSGAVEACWAHNPEVRRSKLRSAMNIFFTCLFYYETKVNDYTFFQKNDKKKKSNKKKVEKRNSRA